jgi:hypothetical protein
VTAVDPFLAARVAELGVPLSADWAPPKTVAYRWQELRTELVSMACAYMPATAVIKATDLLDELIVELGAPGLAPRDGAEAGR